MSFFSSDYFKQAPYYLAGLFGLGYIIFDYHKTQQAISKMEQSLQALNEQQRSSNLSDLRIGGNVLNQGSNHDLSQQRRQVYCICITGGPDSGRTSALSILKERLQEFQYNVLIVPFIGELTLNQEKIFSPQLSTKEMHSLIYNKLSLMQHCLDYNKFLASLEKEKDSVILCQGGILDIITYYDITDQFYEDLQDEYQPLATLRDKNYDAVIHLVTNADGLQQNFYYGNTVMNNKTEIENAIKVDKAIQKIWTGHQNHFIIDNRVGSFDKKIERTLRIVQYIIGLPQTNIKWTKYSLDSVNFPPDLYQNRITLTDIFFNNPNDKEIEQERLRIRQTIDGVKQYFHITKKKGEREQPQIFRRFITNAEAQYLLRRSETIKELKRVRVIFTYENQMMQVDLFENNKLGILRMAQQDNNEIKKIPSWLIINKQVDANPKYDSYELAK